MFCRRIQIFLRQYACAVVMLLVACMCDGAECLNLETLEPGQRCVLENLEEGYVQTVYLPRHGGVYSATHRVQGCEMMFGYGLPFSAFLCREEVITFLQGQARRSLIPLKGGGGSSTDCVLLGGNKWSLQNYRVVDFFSPDLTYFVEKECLNLSNAGLCGDGAHALTTEVRKRMIPRFQGIRWSLSLEYAMNPERDINDDHFFYKDFIKKIDRSSRCVILRIPGVAVLVGVIGSFILERSCHSVLEYYPNMSHFSKIKGFPLCAAELFFPRYTSFFLGGSEFHKDMRSLLSKSRRWRGCGEAVYTPLYGRRVIVATC